MSSPLGREVRLGHSSLITSVDGPKCVCVCVPGQDGGPAGENIKTDLADRGKQRQTETRGTASACDHVWKTKGCGEARWG